MDDLTFTLNDSGSGAGCQVEAFSTSRLWFVVVDGGNDGLLLLIMMMTVGDSLVKILKLRFGRDFEPCLWSQY